MAHGPITVHINTEENALLAIDMYTKTISILMDPKNVVRAVIRNSDRVTKRISSMEKHNWRKTKGAATWSPLGLLRLFYRLLMGNSYRPLR